MRAGSPSRKPRVDLGEFGDYPRVLGKVKPRLTWSRYHVVRLLLEAGPDGLTKDQLDAATGNLDSRKVLKALHDSDDDWARVIHLPGGPGLRYRID